MHYITSLLLIYLAELRFHFSPLSATSATFATHPSLSPKKSKLIIDTDVEYAETESGGLCR